MGSRVTDLPIPPVASPMAPLFTDAFKPSRDPTGTKKIRVTFTNDVLLRLRRIRAQLRTAVVDHDTLGLATGHMGYHPEENRLYAFEMWLKTVLGNMSGEYWWNKYIHAAWNHGTTSAFAELGQPVRATHSRTAVLCWRVEQEIIGITGTLVQHLSRAAESVVVKKMKPSVAWRQLAKVFDKIGEERFRLMADHFVIAAHNRARLAVYRALGHLLVGVVPEKNKRPHLHDAAEDDIEVGIRTAEDDDVCEDCADYAEGAPYYLDDVEQALPIHPRCRCRWYPWFDRRFREP